MDNKINQPDSEEVLQRKFAENFEFGIAGLTEIRDITFGVFEHIVWMYQGGRVNQGVALAPKVEKFSNPAMWARHLENIGDIVLKHGIKAIEGKRILDIGCGGTLSRVQAEKLSSYHLGKTDQYPAELFLFDGSLHSTSENTFYYTRFEPWFCRMLDVMGSAGAVGIDARSNEGERFETHQVDLTVPGSLDFLESGSFDIVHCEAIWDSPSLLRALHMKGTKDQIFQEIFVEQPQRLLRPGGINLMESPLRKPDISQ